MSQVSTRFGFILVPLILALGFNTLIIFFLVKDLGVNDVYLKNGGSIRAGIQRTAKLMAAGRDPKESIDLVNLRFSQILEDQGDGFNLYRKPREKYFANLLQVKKDWETMTSIKDPSKILILSEEIWNLDQSVSEFTMELTARKKIIFFFLFFTIASNFLLTMYVFYLNVSLVRNYLEPAAHHDSLTNALVRRSFHQHLKRGIFRSRRQVKDISILVMDIDHFKKINDQQGHDAGDKVLIQLAKVVKNLVRKDDIFARIGGEEFAVLAHDANLQSAMDLAEKIRRAVEAHDFELSHPVTVSVGVATFIAGETENEFIKRADEALYRAKNSGRNKVCE